MLTITLRKENRQFKLDFGQKGSTKPKKINIKALRFGDKQPRVTMIWSPVTHFYEFSHNIYNFKWSVTPMLE